jgi:hypothetical protein
MNLCISCHRDFSFIRASTPTASRHATEVREGRVTHLDAHDARSYAETTNSNGGGTAQTAPRPTPRRKSP